MGRALRIAMAYDKKVALQAFTAGATAADNNNRLMTDSELERAFDEWWAKRKAPPR